VWPLPQGDPIILPPVRRRRILCLAFGPDCRRQEKDGGPPWLLAAGDAGSTVTIWDLRARAPLTFCRSSHHDVHAVAFSPDGMTLASGGRLTKLWDVASGRQLLNFRYGDPEPALAFSPHGQRL